MKRRLFRSMVVLVLCLSLLPLPVQALRPGTNAGVQNSAAAPAPVTRPVRVLSSRNGAVVSDHDSAASGEIVTLTAAPDSGYALDKLTVMEINGSPVPFTRLDSIHFSFTMPERSVSVTALFSARHTYTYAVQALSGGHGSVAASQDSADGGETITLTITPDSDYALERLTITGVDGNYIPYARQDETRFTFVMPSRDVTVAASFSKQVSYTYHVRTLSARSGSVSADRSTAGAGETVTLTVTPNHGYTLDKLAVTRTNGHTVSVEKRDETHYAFTMPACDVSVVANFHQSSPRTYSVRVLSAEYGSIEADRPSAGSGETVTISLQPDSGCLLEKLTVTGSNGREISCSKRDSTHYTFPMPDRDVFVTAVFTNPMDYTYPVTVLAAEHGAVETDCISAAAGDSVSLAVTSEKGYTLELLTVTGTDGSRIPCTAQDSTHYSFSMPASPVTVTALFFKGTAYTYPIQVLSAEHGTVFADRSSASQGDTVTLTITPDSGYSLEHLTITGTNGNAIPCATQDGLHYTFQMPGRDVAVTAVFSDAASHTYQIKILSARFGTVAADHTRAASRTPITLTVTPDRGYALDKLTITATNGSTISFDKTGDTQYTFLMPAREVTVTAVFTNGLGGSPDSSDKDSGGNQSRYAITISSAANGSISSSHSIAARGAVVTLTIQPESGYVLDALAVTGKNNSGVQLTASGSGQYTFTMPAFNVTVASHFAPGSQGQRECTGGETCPSRQFSDLDTSMWYHQAIDYALEHHLMSGYSGKVFGPNHQLSRAMLAQILYTREGRPSVARRSAFTDVPDNMWCADAVNWAVGRGIVSGYDENRFGPDDIMTREQIAVVLWRYAGSPASSQALRFQDADRISDYAREAMQWAVQSNIIHGYNNGTLNAGGLTTRAQTAQILKNYFEQQPN